MKYTNHLIRETSPYLLQHAHNPVDWYAWKEEAFAKARAENKPILVSIGYSTCHWCHVMERESFEDEQTAAFMNRHFINIKVDREERPDVDQIYMEAVQAISGSGGWPLNCFLTPEGKPFFGGTYYPPQPMYKRPSWPQVLQHIRRVFAEQREVVEEQAKRLVRHIEGASKTFINEAVDLETAEGVFSPTAARQVYGNLKDRFDTQDGGIGGAPKFPNTSSLQFLLHYYYHTGEEMAREHALFSLEKMIRGGIYDQLGGGFARYATDKSWLIPHFEKMLYDNALLVSTLSEAYQLTGKEIFKETIESTLGFIEREMSTSDPAFFSALDADSEGVEGKFYVWDQEEIDAVLGEDRLLFKEFYGVTPSGNWEGKNILWRPYRYEEYAGKKDLAKAVLQDKLAQARKILLQKRADRVRPGLDHKVLLSWNALQCAAYADAYMAVGRKDYWQQAVDSAAFLCRAFKKGEELTLFHTLSFTDPEGEEDRQAELQYEAFLDDYAFLIRALLKVYEISFEPSYIFLARGYADLVIDQFRDEQSGLFYYTAKAQRDVIVRKVEVYDGATPSGNAVMVENLQKLAMLTEHEGYRKMAVNMLARLSGSIEKYPGSFGQWALAALNEAFPRAEVAVVGPEAHRLAAVINRRFMPGRIVMAAKAADDRFPLLRGKGATDDTLIYLCSNYACQKPVTTIEDFVEQLA